MKKIVLLLLLALNGLGALAQTDQATMADTFRSSGKIYVVIAIIVIIFLGLAIYLFSMDKRLRKIEKFEKK
ncbi:CcmD family protein [Mucilaginibacter boryungensis]|uniref:CcmD family protein n=1 Tax=Mucilaginibacter boryungensis TaxID=768480 RepID=A0ABR9XHW1_9SPHI|nr:CcmD family protein [Mucilaginibacter boryungensis]MBE9666604.1 CcmD family protein [Mucilaginibacter boryungensis]